MSYPSTSDFTAPGNDPFNPPAWWTYTRDDGSLNVCETTGAAAIRRIRAAVGYSADPVWDSNLQSALLSQAQTFANTQPGWDSVINALSQHSISPLAMQFALWLAYYQANGMRLDAVGIPDGTILPSLGTRIQDAGGDSLTCFDPQRDPNPGVLSQGDLAAAQNQSSYGIRLRPGENPPSPAPPVPPGPAGLSTRMIVGILVVLAGAAVVVAVVNKKRIAPKSAEPRKNPRRVSRRGDRR